MSDYQMFEAIVRDVEQITAQVKRFTLVSPTGAPLPGFSGGSHIIVQMQDGEQRYSNAYSLMSSPLDTTSWQIAVRLESPSKGGSRFMHQQVRPGDTLTVSTPNNLFAIEPQARKHLLIAGGIGITPFLSHIPELEQQQEETGGVQTQMQRVRELAQVSQLTRELVVLLVHRVIVSPKDTLTGEQKITIEWNF